MITGMSELAVVGKRFAIVIPKAVREKVNLEEGQEVWIGVRGGDIVVEPLPKDPYAVLKRVIGEPYDEKKDEPRAEELLKKLAGS
jgi:AbrB family looped-hinge helix DNA binding protein